MKKLGILLAFVTVALFFTGSVYGQAPDKYNFDTPENCHKYDKDIVKYVNWLERTPPGADDDRVARSSRFLLEFMTNAPYVKFTPNMRIDVYLDEAPQYKLYYMAGWAKYALESHMAKPDKRLCAYAGLKTVLKVYKAANKVKKDPNIEELLDLEAKSRLKSWVDERV